MIIMGARVNIQASFIKEDKQTRVIELYRQGLSQTEIVAKFKSEGIAISPSTVSKFIKQAREDWRDTRLDDMDAIMEKELKKLDKLETDAQELFLKFNPTCTDLDETFDCSKEASEWVKNLLKIMEQRHKLLGLYKPVKLDVESKNTNVNIDAEQSEEIRREILSRLSPKY